MTNCYCGEPSKFTCAGCKKQKYCTKVCQKRNWPHHKPICKNNYFVVPESNIQGMYASMDIAVGTTILIEDHIVCVRNFELVDKDDSYSMINDKFESPDKYLPKIFKRGEYNSTVSLLGAVMYNMEKIEKIYGKEWIESFYKNKHSEFMKHVTNEERRYIDKLSTWYKVNFKEVAKIMNVIKNNCFNSDNIQSSGSSKYSSLDMISSKFNHRCSGYHNCGRTLFPGFIAITTMVDVSAGEELTIDYGDNFKNENGVICKCGYCEKEYKRPDVDDTSWLMVMREGEGEISKVYKNAVVDFDSYLKYGNEEHVYVFGGVEIWYHPIYDAEKACSEWQKWCLLKAMIYSLAAKYGRRDIYEFLIYGVINTRLIGEMAYKSKGGMKFVLEALSKVPLRKDLMLKRKA